MAASLGGASVLGAVGRSGFYPVHFGILDLNLSIISVQRNKLIIENRGNDWLNKVPMLNP